MTLLVESEPPSERYLTGPVVRFLIASLPDACRDEVAGDLIEEATSIVAPASGNAAAKRWLRSQLFSSMPAMISLHFRQKENDEMKYAKWIGAALIVLMGTVQAWDSGVLAAPPMIGAIVVIAIAAGLAGVFIDHDGIRFGIAVSVFALLFAARMLSPVSLPELGLIGMPVFFILVLGPKFLALRNEKRGPRGPGAPA